MLSVIRLNCQLAVSIVSNAFQLIRVVIDWIDRNVWS